MSTSQATSLRIGVFDSGIGGLSVLKALQQTLPGASWLYLSDSGHGPYGEREAGHVLARSLRSAAFLRSQGAQALVIACNTATAAAVTALREADPIWPIVGMEPGLKPAIGMTRTGHVGVMATEATLGSERFQRLVRSCIDQGQRQLRVHAIACPGLAWAIENEEPDSPALAEAIDRACAPLRGSPCDVVVLGCTHYPLVKRRLQEALGPGVHLIDTGPAVAMQTARATAAFAPVPWEGPRLQLWSSGSTAALACAAQRHLISVVPLQASDWQG